MVAQHVLEGGRAGAVRVGALGDLRELVGVAEQDERAGGAADRHDVGEGHLPGLVDEEHVHERLAISSRAKSQGVPAAARNDPSWSPDSTASLSLARSTSGRTEPSPLSHFWTIGTRTPACSAARQTSSTRLVMALWAVAQMPTRFPARTSSTIIRAPT